VRLLVQKQNLREADVQLEHLEKTAKGLFVDVREAILGLRLAGRFQSGLKEALKEYISEFSHLSAIKTRFECSANLNYGIVPPEVEQHIYRIVQEALNNCRKHSNADMVELNIYQRATDLIVEIVDNGVGFDPNKVDKMEPTRLGLSNMRDRADELSAVFKLGTRPGEGTRIKVTIPKCYKETGT